MTLNPLEPGPLPDPRPTTCETPCWFHHLYPGTLPADAY
jgi:hypothetical protein